MVIRRSHNLSHMIMTFILVPLLWAVQLVPEEEVSPVDGVEDEEEEGGEVEEESVHLCIVIIPCVALLPCLLLGLHQTVSSLSLNNS